MLHYFCVYDTYSVLHSRSGFGGEVQRGVYKSQLAHKVNPTVLEMELFLYRESDRDLWQKPFKALRGTLSDRNLVNLTGT